MNLKFFFQIISIDRANSAPVATFRRLGSGDGQEQATLSKGWERRVQDCSHPRFAGAMLYWFRAGKGGRRPGALDFGTVPSRQIGRRPNCICAVA